LLKQRVNKQYITNSIESAEERLQAILKKFDEGGLERLENVAKEQKAKNRQLEDLIE